MKIGQKLRQIRNKRDLSQYRLAELSGVSISQVSRIESEDQKNPTIETVISLSKALECSILELIGEQETEGEYISRQLAGLSDIDKNIALKMLKGWSLACREK